MQVCREGQGTERGNKKRRGGLGTPQFFLLESPLPSPPPGSAAGLVTWVIPALPPCPSPPGFPQGPHSC